MFEKKNVLRSLSRLQRFAFLLGLAFIPFIFLRLAFGPLHDSVTIDLGTEGKLICVETYNGDFADEFYEVEMILKTLNGEEHDLGSITFHNQDWRKRITTRRVGDWIVFSIRAGEICSS
jgi:hypothetical protein